MGMMLVVTAGGLHAVLQHEDRPGSVAFGDPDSDAMTLRLGGFGAAGSVHVDGDATVAAGPCLPSADWSF